MNHAYPLNTLFEDLSPSSTLYINETVNRLWQDGEQVFHMGFGESRFDVHPRLKKALAQHANKKSYLPGRGLPPLIDAVSDYYSSKLDIDFAPSQVIVGPGSKVLIYALQAVLGADLFLPTPSWVSYAPQASMLGNRCRYIPARVENNYQLDLQELDKLVQESTNPSKLLILNSPNNPSGGAISDALLEQIADYCRANNILVLSDEIYFQLCFDPGTHTSIASYYPEGSFVFGGLSKHLSLGGWRIGVALVPPGDFGRKVMQNLLIFASETWSSVSAPIQYAAIEAYRLHPDIEDYVSDCCAIHAIRSRYIHSQLSALGIHCSAAEGAFYIAANFDSFKQGLLNSGVTTSTDLCHHLLEKWQIASLPGSDFGVPPQILTIRLSTSYLDMEGDDDPDRIYHLYKSGHTGEQLMKQEHHPVTASAMRAFAAFLNSLN